MLPLKTYIAIHTSFVSTYDNPIDMTQEQANGMQRAVLGTSYQKVRGTKHQKNDVLGCSAKQKVCYMMLQLDSSAFNCLLAVATCRLKHNNLTSCKYTRNKQQRWY